MRKCATRVLGVLLLTCLGAAVASATQYPNATYPDTLTIWHIQNGTAGVVPHPIKPDTVRGISGIVTGFDALPTGFAFYIQTTTAFDSNGPLRGWDGLDVFTGSFNKQCVGVNLGDSVVVYGKVQEFGGESEIEGFDNSQSTDDLIIRNLGPSGSFPAVHIGTVAELKEGPFAAPFGADSVREKWEGMLVQVNGPLRVVRGSTTGGLGTNNSFLVVDNTVCPTGSPGPCDSMFVDGNTLTQITPPAVGTTLFAVRGIYNQRTRGFRIQLRNGNDMNDPSPPGLVDAYPVEDNIVRVIVDRDVTNASATNTANYSLASFGTILSANQVDGTTIDVTISNGLPDGAAEAITVNGLVRASNSAVMTTPATRNFVNGVMSCALIQAPSPDSLARLAGCRDVSQFVGSANGSGVRLSFRGTVTGNQGSLYYLEDAAGGARAAVSLFAPICPLVRGHQYLVAGAPQEFPVVFNNGTETEIVGNVYLKDEGILANVYPDIQTVAVLRDTSCDATQSVTNGEDYEFNLVRVWNVMVTQKHRARQTFRVAGPYPTFTDTMSIDSTGIWGFTEGDSGHVVSVTGVLRLNFGQWRIQPRDSSDLIDHGFTPAGVPGITPSRVSFVAFPNPSRTAKMAFSLPSEAEVELGVYDLQGRQVAVVARGRFAPGVYTREWNGLKRDGKAAEAGVYFYRLKVASEIRNIRGIHLN